MSKSDAILVRPPQDITVTDYDFVESLGLGYLVTEARSAGFRVEYIDALIGGIAKQELAEEILRSNPPLVGFSVMEPWYSAVAEICRTLKREGYEGHIVLGNQYATFLADEVLTDIPIDCIVSYEADESFIDLLNCVTLKSDWRNVQNLAFLATGRVVKNPLKPLIKDLDKLPIPSHEWFEKARDRYPSISVAGSRGCYAKCRFCTIPGFYGPQKGPGWRGRSPESIVDEIESVTREHQTFNVTFVDENFFGPGTKGKERVKAICREILTRGLDITFSIDCRPDDVSYEIFKLLKKAGLRTVFMGVETVSDRELEYYGKSTSRVVNEKAVSILNEIDIDVLCGFIPFGPISTLDDIEANLDFAFNLDNLDIFELFRRLENRPGMALYSRSSPCGRNTDTELLYDFLQENFRKYISGGALIRTLDGVSDNGYNTRIADIKNEFKAGIFRSFREAIGIIREKNDLTPFGMIVRERSENIYEKIKGLYTEVEESRS